jgi:hypothetical protein
VRRVLSTWDEGGIYWVNSPMVDDDSAFAVIKPPQTGPFEIDVLRLYHDGIDPIHGLRFALDSDEQGKSTTETIRIHSREAGDSPISPTVILKYTH